MKILIADDDPTSLRLMQRALEFHGYKVTAASDGAQAAQALSAPGGPRLALIDWMMPELDGPSVCRQVRGRQDGAYVYMMLLTSKESREDLVNGLEAGADDYLTKPCHPAELRARLHTGRRILQLEDNLVEAREEMRFRATHDALTRIWNRGGIFTVLRSELSRASLAGTSVSVLLCDVDRFKQINDVYGHPVGDEVLREVASRLQCQVQPHHHVGRYGGEEFLVVLGGCSNQRLEEWAEHLRERICSIPFSTYAGPLQVSVSIGAITIDDCESEDKIDLYLKEADAALYRAKAAGRNRVVCVASDAPMIGV